MSWPVRKGPSITLLWYNTTHRLERNKQKNFCLDNTLFSVFVLKCAPKNKPVFQPKVTDLDSVISCKVDRGCSLGLMLALTM